MKTIMKIWISAMLMCFFGATASFAQKVDEERMKRDIEVGENVLATLIKQELGGERRFFGMDVNGSYLPGYGVTFRLPPGHAIPFVMSLGVNPETATVIHDGNGYQYSFRFDSPDGPPEPGDQRYKLRDRARENRKNGEDSVRAYIRQGLINAATSFILDYGDFLSQLSPAEKIVVTNQGEAPHNFYFNAGKQARISVEGSRSDIIALRAGKISRAEALKKLTIVNTESVDEREPDMEMLSSIFTRLYRPDLSKTYFVQGNVYYERLKDYGAIFYMQMVSSNQTALNSFVMPTLKLDNLDQNARDEKVKELYPVFEQDLKNNILEYGRTVKSLKDEEVLVFNISLTKCEGCGIPSTLEASIPATVLKDYGAGKKSQQEAMRSFSIKKGAKQ